MFCWQNYGITPDVFTLAKAIAGGLPMGIMLCREDLAGLLPPGTHASTFGGGPVVCKAALAVLATVQKEKLAVKAVSLGGYLREGLKRLQAKYDFVTDVRGMGLMCGMELSVPGAPVVDRAREAGLLINCTHDKVLRIMPALTTTEKEIDKALKLLDGALQGGKR